MARVKLLQHPNPRNINGIRVIIRRNDPTAEQSFSHQNSLPVGGISSQIRHFSLFAGLRMTFISPPIR